MPTNFKAGYLIALRAVAIFCLSGMVAGFARTKESESPGEQGPQAWVGFIGTELSCKARRIQRRRVNGKAGIRANLQRMRRL